MTTTYGTGFTPAVTGNDHNAAVTFTYKDSNGSPITGTPTAVGSYSGTASFAAKLVEENDGTKTFYPATTKTFTVEITPTGSSEQPSTPVDEPTNNTNFEQDSSSANTGKSDTIPQTGDNNTVLGLTLLATSLASMFVIAAIRVSRRQSRRRR